MKKLMNDKRGVMRIIFFFLILFTIVIVGIVLSITVALFDFASDEITPIMTTLGQAGGANLTEAGVVTFGTLQVVTNALPWVAAFGYVAMLIFSLVFVMSWKINPNPVFLGLYVMFVILLIFGTIILSNTYQDIYQGDNILGTRLTEQTALSYMILYSPFIMTLIAFMVGIYAFAGRQSEFQGGFDI